MQTLNDNAYLSSGAKDKKFDSILHLISFFVATGSEGSSETALRISTVSLELSLPAYVTNTIEACAGSFILNLGLIMNLSICLD